MREMMQQFDEPVERIRRSGSRSHFQARALLQQQFGWLPAYVDPDDGTRWFHVPWDRPGSPEIRVMDREALRRLELGLRQLQTRYRSQLTELMEDPADWILRMEALLAVLKDYHHPRGFPDIAAMLRVGPAPARWRRALADLQRDYPRLRRLIDAVAMVEWTGLRRPQESALSWIANHADSLARFAWDTRLTDLQVPVRAMALREKIPTPVLIRMLSLLQSSARGLGVDAIARWDPNSRPGSDTWILACSQRHSKETVGDLLLRVTDQLLQLGPARRSLLGQLLQIVWPADFVDQISAAAQWHKHQPLPTAATSEFAAEDSLQPWITHQRASLNTICRVFRILLSVARVPTVMQWHRLQVILEGDALLSGVDPPSRLQWVSQWYLWCVPSPTYSGITTFLREWKRLVARRGCCDALVRLMCDSVDGGLLDAVCTNASIPSVRYSIKLCEKLLFDDGLTIAPKDVDVLYSFADAATADPEWGYQSPHDRLDALASTWFRRASQGGDTYLSPDSIRAALALSDEYPSDDAFDLLVALKNQECDDQALLVLRIGALVTDPYIRRVARQWVLHGARARVADLASVITLVQLAGGTLPSLEDASRHDTWIDHYPHELHPVLAELNALLPQAEECARRVWRDEIQSVEDIATELAALGQRLEAVKHSDADKYRLLSRRQQILSERLASPPTATSRQLQRLSQQLQRRVDDLKIQRYLKQCHQIVAARLRFQVPTETPKDTSQLAAAIAENAGIVTAIVTLPKKSRAMGLAVLARYLDDPSANFLDEPANAEFLLAMQQRGIHLDLWVGNDFRRHATGRDGAPYSLALARDVIDVLQMGAHFKTCTAPGEMHFDSALAIALDVNKQVLYGRRTDGTVVGRCLLALTDNGQILTYQPYAHHDDDGFEAAAWQFANELAAAMGTSWVSHGTVSCLVASQWYDDGPRSVMDFFEDEWNALTQPETAAAQWARLVSRLGSAKRVAKGIVERGCHCQNPKWPECLMEQLECVALADELAPKLRWELAVLAQASGWGDLARAILSKLSTREVFSRPLEYFCHDCRGYHLQRSSPARLDLLIDWNPTFALREIRKTRSRQVPSDRDEPDQVRRLALARIHRILGRTQVAQELESPRQPEASDDDENSPRLPAR